MDSSAYKFPRLQGSSNWEIWSMRAEALLTQKGYFTVMTPKRDPPQEPSYKNGLMLDKDQAEAQKLTQENYQQELAEYQEYSANRAIQSYQAASLIRLLLEDGPLLQTRGINDALELWNRLKTLYEQSGFSSEFLISRELFSTTLERCKGSIEGYLTRIQRLTDELAAKKLAILNKVIAAYTLSNLGPEWENTVAIISQSYRSHNGDIDLLTLFSQLIDESRRRQAIQHLDEMAIATQGGQGRSIKAIRPKCSHCNRTGHYPDKCWTKHPHLMPYKVSAELNKARD